MRKLQCPGCSGEMQEKDLTDIKIDECPSCGGIFLDKVELNVLATGMAGDLEYCSTDASVPADIFPDRKCPVCKRKTMKKVNLLEYTHIMFDYCPSCQGFYLDKEELQKMNKKLQRLHYGRRAQEFRGEIDGHLVRVDTLYTVQLVYSPLSGGAVSKPAAQQYLKISVFFNRPLNLEFRLHNEKWTVKLAKAFRLFRGQDIQIGDDAFDSSFIVEGKDPSETKALLSPKLQKILLKLKKGPDKIFKVKGTVWMFDEKVVYLEGPYIDYLSTRRDDITSSSKILKSAVTRKLLKIAGIVDER